MIVVDASALIELLFGRQNSDEIGERLFGAGDIVLAPHLIDLEVAQVTRRFLLRREIDPPRGRAALADLATLPINRHGHGPLLPRIWEMRDNLTAYDAAYLALAEALDATLVTRDARLAAAPGHRARVELV